MAASLHSPIRSPSRRVLGDKSTNMTLIVTPKSKRTMDASDSIDVIKSNLLQEGIEVSKKHILTPTASVGKLAGQKRGIDMVEDAEREERQSQRENIHKEEQEGNDGRKEVVGAATGPRRFTTIPSFHASQEGPMEIEEQFNIQDEMSQGAVDNLNATPLPQSITRFPSFAAEQSQDSQGLSSLIDFDPEEEGKTEKTSPMSERIVVSVDAGFATDLVEDRSAVVGKKADLLRARLQLAMYKIQTNQIDRSLTQLIHRSRDRSPSLPPNRLASPESRIATARSVATGQDKPHIANLNALAVPALVPTEYSARLMESNEDEQDVPSSPPSSEEEDASTPRPKQSLALSQSFCGLETPMTPNARSMGPGEGHKEETQTLGRQSSHAGNLTSSVIKGEAANGLLELMKMGR